MYNIHFENILMAGYLFLTYRLLNTLVVGEIGGWAQRRSV